jgi:hypothetical protein
MTPGFMARPIRTWLLFGVFAGFAVYALVPVGLPLAVLLLAVAIVASVRKRAPGAWVAYLCGLGMMAVPIALALAVVSQTAGALLILGVAAVLALGVAALGLRRDRGMHVSGR